MKLIIYLCGSHAIAFAAFHFLFWGLFKWKEELRKLSPVNKAIMQILNVRLIYIFLLVAFLCFRFPVELTTTPLGRAFLGGMSLFWITRAIEQFVFLQIKHTFVYVVTLCFIIGAALFAAPLFLWSVAS